MSFDNLFFDLVSRLRAIPSVSISFLNFVICLGFIYLLRKSFGYAGLCACMVLSSVLSNVQVLYATSYFQMEVLLGTVTFCSSFLVTDIINFEYGCDKAKRAVYLTVVMDLFFLLNVILTLGHRPIDYTDFPDFGISQETNVKNINAITQIFLPIPRLLIGSYCAFLFSQLSEIWLINLARKIEFVRSMFLKHNVCLFVSSICLDTFIFTSVSLCLLSSEPLNHSDLSQICASAVLVRGFCNLGNSLFIKILRICECK